MCPLCRHPAGPRGVSRGVYLSAEDFGDQFAFAFIQRAAVESGEKYASTWCAPSEAVCPAQSANRGIRRRFFESRARSLVACFVFDEGNYLCWEVKKGEQQETFEDFFGQS